MTTDEQPAKHVHTWGEWTPRDGANMPWWRGCTSCSATERQAAEQALATEQGGGADA